MSSQLDLIFGGHATQLHSMALPHEEKQTESSKLPESHSENTLLTEQGETELRKLMEEMGEVEEWAKRVDEWIQKRDQTVLRRHGTIENWNEETWEVALPEDVFSQPSTVNEIDLNENDWVYPGSDDESGKPRNVQQHMESSIECLTKMLGSESQSDVSNS